MSISVPSVGTDLGNITSNVSEGQAALANQRGQQLEVAAVDAATGGGGGVSDTSAMYGGFSTYA
jgi:hypothetical protein